MLLVPSRAPLPAAHRSDSAVADAGGVALVVSPPPVDNEAAPLIIDMGSHWLDSGLGAAPLVGGRAGGGGAHVAGVRLAQVITRLLAPRAAGWGCLVTPQQV